MKALSALSKYLGVYEEWKRLVKNYGLKWVGRSADDIFLDRLTKIVHPDEVFDWIRQVKTARPDLSVLMDLNAATGLRFIESVESYNIIIRLAREGNLDKYYNVEKGTLEHYRFKETFIRRTKKAFISFVPASLVKRVSEEEPLNWQGVETKINRRGLPLRFGDVRDAHGTFLTKHLRQPEIDFLHGRVSTSVFMRNYFNPALISDLKTRTFRAANEILAKIS